MTQKVYSTQRAWIFLLLLSVLCFSPSAKAQAKLSMIKDFGTNPGKLDMWFYQPLEVKGTLPLVVVLHGCSQQARNFVNESGWLDLAVMHEFGLIAPQQDFLNNPSLCFNWFNKNDQVKGSGELGSIHQMIEYALKNGPFDPSQVYVYGASAGGGMAMALLANYPETFDAGACLAGVPYGAAEKWSDVFTMTSFVKERSQESWISEVRKTNPTYTGPYPKLIVMHGEKDNTVDVAYADAIVSQWTGITGCPWQPQESRKPFAPYADVNRFVYSDGEGNWKVISYRIPEGGHQVPVNPGTGEDQGGKTGIFAKKMDFFSTYLIAKDFGLVSK
jgi:poly(hydroxyalkanoate) depolymerase family esterase